MFCGNEACAPPLASFLLLERGRKFEDSKILRGIKEKPLITGNKKNLLEKTDKSIFVRNRAYEIIRRKKWFRSKGSIEKGK